mmetsp:Transcript_26853/g.48406  ORF Transcript_26853/g.48406 Transcript_26853/m.48406 type:complete len:261 (-) Transcript_26853:41-823(-)
MVWSGVFGVSNAQMFFCLGLINSKAAETCAGMLLVPMCVFILGFFIGPERPKLCKCLGIMIALFGASLMLITVTEYKEAEVLLFCHALCASSSVIVIRRLTQGEGALNPLVVSLWSFVIGTVCMFMVFIGTWLFLYPYTWEQSFFGTVEMVGTLYLLQVTYAVTFVVMAWCFSHGAITKVAMYVSSRPIFAYIINLTYDETSDVNQRSLYACVGLMLVGFFTAFFSKKREQLRKLRADRRKREEVTRESIDPFKQKLISS